jgi:hypothetical protein
MSVRFVGVRPPAFTLPALAALLLAFGSPLHAEAQAMPVDAVATPLVATPLASPNPVLGSDAKTHLAYELVLMSMAASPVSIDKIETLDADSDALLGTLEGDGLAQMLRLNGGAKGTELPAASGGFVFMDVALPKGAAVPKALTHRFKISVANAPEAGSAGDHDPAPPPPQQLSFVGDRLPVGAPAVVVAPPLRGKHWVIGGGCCTPYSYHRGATLPLNGTVHVAERFAIDFVQLNDKNMLYTGDMHEVKDYAYFGDEIYAVAPGTVVAAEDGLPEQVPGKLPDDATIQTAPGNHVVVDIGQGRFAFYAHMQPGSLKVKVGDTVTTGQVLGLLGNTGNTDTPHLHFHVMDGPSPLLANGLPYTFTSFAGEGRLTDEQPLFTGGVVTIDKDALSGPHENEMPLFDQVVSFP